MPFAQITYSADGSTTDFAFSFSYNNQTEILVWDTPSGSNTPILKNVTVDYTFFDAQTIRFNSAPTAGDFIFIERVTDMSKRPDNTNWTDTDRLRATEHNLEDNTDLYRSQENKDNRGIQINRANGQWTAADENGGVLRIEDVNDPLTDFHAVNLRTLENRISGGTSGIAGYFRAQFTGDGITKSFELIPVDQGKMTAKDQAIVMFDGRDIDPSSWNLDAAGRSLVFVNAPGNGVEIDMWVVTSALTTFLDGGIAPNKISIPLDDLLTGDASGLGTAITRSSLLLSELGLPTSDISMNSNKITSLTTPTADTDAANKAYVDTSVSTVSTFSTITNNVSYTRGDVIHNISGGTELILMSFDITSSSTNSVAYAAQYADDAAMTVNLINTGVTTRIHRDYRDDKQISILVPNGKYWHVVITSGSDNASRILTTFQKGS